MLDTVKKKALTNLLLSPLSGAPMVLGFTALMLAWANDGPVMAVFLGLAGLVSGVGILATRFMVSFDGLMRKAFEEVQKEEQKNKDDKITDLRYRLGNQSSSLVELLDKLLSAYRMFNENINRPDVSLPTKSLLVQKVDLLYQGCLKELNHVLDLSQQIKGVNGAPAKLLRAKRDKVLKDIQGSIEQMGGAFEQAVSISVDNGGNLSDLRKELETSMRIARKTDERMAELGLKERI